MAITRSARCEREARRAGGTARPAAAATALAAMLLMAPESSHAAAAGSPAASPSTVPAPTATAMSSDSGTAPAAGSTLLQQDGRPTLLVQRGSARGEQDRGGGDEKRELTRRQRCRINPFDQWCILGGVGASIGMDTNNDLSYGFGAQAGTFPLPYLALSTDVGFHQRRLDPDPLNRYDWGLTARVFIPLGNYLLVPGYRGGLFWYRNALSGNGYIHGPQLSINTRLGGSVYFGILGSYQWITFEGQTDTFWTIAPSLTFAF